MSPAAKTSPSLTCPVGGCRVWLIIVEPRLQVWLYFDPKSIFKKNKHLQAAETWLSKPYTNGFVWSPVNLSLVCLLRGEKGGRKTRGERKTGREGLEESGPRALGTWLAGSLLSREVSSLRSYRSPGHSQTQGLALAIWVHRSIFTWHFSKSKGFRLELCSNLCPSEVKHSQVWASTSSNVETVTFKILFR